MIFLAIHQLLASSSSSSSYLIKMLQNPSLRLLLVLSLVFSYDLSSSAVPATRSLGSEEKDLSVQESLGLVDVGRGDEVFDAGEGESFIEGRMAIESEDYPGTGANNHHDPRTPGKA
ncbi:unnamed protein product [Malus baccata var. baccata]